MFSVSALKKVKKVLHIQQRTSVMADNLEALRYISLQKKSSNITFCRFVIEFE